MCNQRVQLNFPWRALNYLHKIPLNKSWGAIWSSLGSTQVWAHNQYEAYIWYEQYDAMQDIREIEFRDSGSNANTEICFEVRAIALRPRLHTEGFPLRPHRTSHKGNLYWGICNYKLGLYNSSLNTTTSTQEARHKAKLQSQSPLHKEG